MPVLGYCAMTEERVRPAPERGELAGLPVLRLAVTSGRWEVRRLDRGASRLRRAGVRRVLAPEGFPHWDRLRAAGLEPVDPWPLLRRLAPSLALAWLEGGGLPPERSAVALRGRSAAELAPAALALCPRVGALILSAPGGEGLEGRLRQEFGAAPLADRRGGRCALALHFAPGLPRGEEPVLELWSGAPPLRGLALSAPGLPVPPPCPAGQLLAALWEAGRLRAEEIGVWAGRRVESLALR